MDNGFEVEFWPYKLFKKSNRYYMTYYDSEALELTKEGFLRRLKKIFEKIF